MRCILGYPKAKARFLVLISDVEQLEYKAEQISSLVNNFTFQSLNSQGDLLYAQGKLWEEQPYYERALAIREQVLGPTHPHTATSLNNLGSLLHDQGDLAAARPLYERALAIAENVLGSAHPHTRIFRSNLERLIAALDDNAPPADPPPGAM